MNLEAEIAGLLAVAGLSGAFYSARKGGPISLWMPLAYFSLMGILQPFSHAIANQCALPVNQVAALLAYFHVCFQPFFINAMALHFLDRRLARKIEVVAYSLCFTSMTIMLIQAYPFNWAGRCDPGSLMCGETLCTITDGWRLSWMLPVTAFANDVPWYALTAIALPLLMGSWRFMLAYGALCLLPAYLIAQNLNEWPGVSALLTIAFVLALIPLSQLRGLLHSRLSRWQAMLVGA